MDIVSEYTELELAKLHESATARAEKLLLSAGDTVGSAALPKSTDRRPESAVFSTLFVRAVRKMTRHPEVAEARTGASIGVGLLIGGVFYGIGDDLDTQRDVLSATLFGTIFMMVISLLPAVSAFFPELAIIVKEHRNGSYQVPTYFLAKMATDVPFLVITPLLFATVLLNMSRLAFRQVVDEGLVARINGTLVDTVIYDNREDALGALSELDGSWEPRIFFPVYLGFVAISLAVAAFGNLCCCLAPNMESATLLAQLPLLVMVLTSGLFRPRPDTSWSVRWFAYVNPASYYNSYSNFFLFQSRRYVVGGIRGAGEALYVQTGTDFLRNDLGFTDIEPSTANAWLCFLGVMVFAVVFYTLAGIAIYLKVTKPVEYATAGAATAGAATAAAPYKGGELKENTALLEEAGGRESTCFGCCDSHDGLDDSVPKLTPVRLAIDHVSITVPVEKGTKDLLNDVSAVFGPRELVAVMGPSGSGKTTLLNAIFGGVKPTSGSVTINGQQFDADTAKTFTALVPQDDMHFVVLTPYETLLDQTMFKTTLSPSAAKERVEQLLSQFGLQECKDVRVGDATLGKVGLSGGQKKRLSVARELVSNPSLLALDEPTTGLDSVSALVLIKAMKELAQSGATIISTIHQPSYPIFTTFDSLLLLSAVVTRETRPAKPSQGPRDRGVLAGDHGLGRDQADRLLDEICDCRHNPLHGHLGFAKVHSLPEVMLWVRSWWYTENAGQGLPLRLFRLTTAFITMITPHPLPREG